MKVKNIDTQEVLDITSQGMPDEAIVSMFEFMKAKGEHNSLRITDNGTYEVNSKDAMMIGYLLGLLNEECSDDTNTLSESGFEFQPARVKTMAPLYKILMNFSNQRNKGPLVHVNVLKKLPNGVDSFHVKCSQGYHHILLKKDKMKKLEERLAMELKRVDNPKIPLVDFNMGAVRGGEECVLHGANNMFEKRVSNIELLPYFMHKASKMLNISAPQIVLLDDHSTRGFSDRDNNCIYVNKHYEVLGTALHELRHLWQYKYHPEWFENYVPYELVGNRGSDFYNSQVAEFDAEVFAYAYMEAFAGCKRYVDMLVASNGKLATWREYAEKAASLLNQPVNGTRVYNRALDYKSIYPDVVM